MITEEQQKWLNHLNDSDRVIIVPWDPTAEDKFQIIKNQIQSLIGGEFKIEHRGASSLKISGQDEIDIYIPVKTDQFDWIVKKLTELYGDPRSNYPLKRVRFVTFVRGKHVDVFVINRDDDGWKDSEVFYNYLFNHPDKLEEYRILKESLVGKSTKIYYAAKIDFINDILSIANSAQ